MPLETVFITGATGHIGFKTLVLVLQAGYQVRAAIRSESKKDQILRTASIKAINPGSRLTFFIVPDLTASNAYDEAIKGATYAIHLASPIVLKGEILPENFQSDLIQPAIAGTIGILKAAIQTPTIKRIVITSSIVALIHRKYFFDQDTELGSVWDSKSRTPVDQGPFPSDFHAYNASKVGALEATDKFMADNKTTFDLVHIDPAFVIGRNELINDPKEIHIGTNGPLAGHVIYGNRVDYLLAGATVHVDDIALMHLKALDVAIPAGHYVGNSEGYAGTVWDNAARIVAEHFPDAVSKGVLKIDGKQGTRRMRIDASETENVMGFKFKSFEEQVKSVVQHYLDLLHGT
jgi:nucleoside-diphosphate-sugar epimerase